MAHNSHVIHIYQNIKGDNYVNNNTNSKLYIRKQTDNEIDLFIKVLNKEKWDMIDEFNPGKITN